MAENQPKENIQQPAKKKTSRLKVVLIILALLFSLLVLKVILLITAKPTISVDYLSEFNRISKPADYDPNQNAAPYYQKAFDVLNSMSPDRQDIWRVRPADMNDSQIEFLESWLESNSEALGYLKQAVQKPYYWVQVHRVRYEDNSLETIDLSHLAKFRQAAYCLRFQAKLQIAKGHLEQAFDNVISLKKIAAHFYDSKSWVTQLVAMAIDAPATEIAFEILNNSEIDSKTLTDFQSRFEQSLQVQKRIPFGGERIFTCDAIQQVFTDDGSGDGRLIPHQLFRYRGYPHILRGTCSKPRFYFTTAKIYLGMVWASLNHPTRRETIELVKEFYDLLDKLGQKTLWQLHQKDTSYEEQIHKLIQGNYFVRSRFSHRDRIFQIYHRHSASKNALITTLAILRYKADNGKLPADLQELVSANYLKDLPIDPFGPGSLTYKRIDDDFKLYSFGLDFDDDGGVGYRWGYGEEGGDQLFWPVSRKQK